jgi:hypothetical protein
VSSFLGLRQSSSRINIGLLGPEDDGTVLLETSVNTYQLMYNIPEDLIFNKATMRSSYLPEFLF